MSFALQALCARFIAENGKTLEKTAMNVPQELDSRVALLKLRSLGYEIDALSDDQKNYLAGWEA